MSLTLSPALVLDTGLLMSQLLGLYLKQFVYTMYKAFIEPGFSGLLKSKYPFTGFQSPTYILKSRKDVSVDQI
ncbi:unnamed protein product, partial [Brassica rapa]